MIAYQVEVAVLVVLENVLAGQYTFLGSIFCKSYFMFGKRCNFNSKQGSHK